MKTTQLRRYVIVDGLYEEFVAWWQEAMPVLRPAMGFAIEFAYGSPETNEFTWAVSVPGDADEFERVDAAYKVSPERAAVFEGLPDRIASMQLSFIQAY
ncbi:hypothetical protein ACFCVO_05135 [Agromyces sp. NPDC056379]|uniref:hypothetical protein n=1 Tax=unclassified Agromyces TaxID=2639701 RepID=UPI0035D94565